MNSITRIVSFLDEAQTYYLATVEGDQPRVRPFGTALEYGGRIYIQTGKVKAVSKQLAANPKAEICAFKDGRWLRISGELIDDDNKTVMTAMLDKMPQLKAMYSPDDGNMQVLYFKNAVAVFSSFTEAPETIKLESCKKEYTKQERVKSLTEKAEQGDSDAQYQLGNCYYWGEGVKRDWQTSVYWFKKSAEQGNPHGEFYLGAAYYDGHGVTRNIGLAAHWLRKAADQGIKEAENMLNRDPEG